MTSRPTAEYGAPYLPITSTRHQPRRNPMTPRPEDLSHAMLVAILMHHGGSMTLPASAFDADALGGRDGSWHAVAMEPQTDGTMRIAVRPRPDGDNGGVTYDI